MKGYGFGGFGSGMGDYLLNPQLALSQQMLGEGTSTAPVGHWVQGLGRVGKALLGAYMQKKVRDDYKAIEANRAEKLNEALGYGRNKEKAISPTSAVPATQIQGISAVTPMEQTRIGAAGIEPRAPQSLNPGYEQVGRVEVPGPMVSPIPDDRIGEMGVDRQLRQQMYGGTRPQVAPVDAQVDTRGVDVSDPANPRIDIEKLTGGMPQPTEAAPVRQNSPYSVDPRSTVQQLPDRNASTMNLQALVGSADPQLRSIGLSLLMKQHELDRQDKIYSRGRRDTLADQDTAFGQKKELTRMQIGAKPPKTDTVAIGGGLEQKVQYNQATRSWDKVGQPFDPNLRSPEAQQQRIESSAASKPVWSTVIGPDGQQTQVSSYGERKPVPKMVLTPAEEAIDKAFSKDYAEFYVGGKLADAQKGLTQIEPVLKDLEDIAAGKSDKNLTGPILGRNPDFVRSIINPESLAAQEAVSEVVQRNLRVILGAQFTEKEGKLLIARAYNPALEEKENAARVKRLITQIKTGLKMKERAAQYYEQHGTLKGFKGTTKFSLQDFYDALEGDITGQRRRKTDLPPGYERE